jgi:hypothetical protein
MSKKALKIDVHNDSLVKAAVRIRDDAVPASSLANWQNGMTGRVESPDGPKYLVALSNGQEAFFWAAQLERLQ